MVHENGSGKRSLTEGLGVFGWQHLDPIVLAALAAQFPVLLIGNHGTAKTFLVDRLAGAMGQEFRHYNASLLNYDDLVGIPLPEDDGESLRFVTIPSAIWNAQFVFFDEISRCRSDLANKMFPIIHERKVVGIALENLQHRWSAMNPPSSDEPDLEAAINEVYIGSEPLDPALLDRFFFVMSVPKWEQLSKEDRRQLIARREPVSKEDIAALGLPSLVEKCAELIPQIEVEYEERITDYMLCVMDLLSKSSLTQTTRRAWMLARTVAAVHAARTVLEGTDDIDLEDSAQLALVYGIPQNATEVPPSPASLVAAHKQAWEIAHRLDDDGWRQILEEPDHVKRVALAEELGFGDEDLSRLITQALNVDESEARNVGLATAMFLAFSRHRILTSAAWEPLVKLANRVLQPRVGTSGTSNRNDMTVWNEIKDWVLTRRQEGWLGWLEVNYVLGCFPDLWRKQNWKESLEQFKADLALFSVQEWNHE